jgi:hypothetical protein
MSMPTFNSPQASALAINQQGGTMKSRMFIAALAFTALPLFAHASCDTAKSGIDAKIKANGVKNYSLDVVAADQADKSGGKVVGQCEGDKAVVYSRGESKVSDDSSTSTRKVKSHLVGRSGQTGG